MLGTWSRFSRQVQRGGSGERISRSTVGRNFKDFDGEEDRGKQQSKSGLPMFGDKFPQYPGELLPAQIPASTESEKSR
jgi:hypothetical protein